MGQDKLWVDVAGRPLLMHTLQRIADAACFDAVVIAAPQQRWQELNARALELRLAGVELVEGGGRRQDSVRLALQRCMSHDHVCVHDAARPLASPVLFRAVVSAAQQAGAATAGVQCTDTIKRVADGVVEETLPRDELIATQTPQAFATRVLADAHERARADGVRADDDALLVERLGQRVRVVPGEERNIKVTHAQDLVLLRALLDTAS